MIVCSLVLHANPRAKSLCELLAQKGFDIVDERDAMAYDDIELLLCFADRDCTPEQQQRWLTAVNRARHDVLVTSSGGQFLAPETAIWLDDQSHAVAEAADRIASFIARAQGDDDELPRLLTVNEHPELDVASTWEELHERLRDPELRVVGVHAAVLEQLRHTVPRSRAEYDVARIAKWSWDRLDRSFVKLRLRLAGGDASSATVVKEVTSLADVITDARSSSLVLVKGAPGAGKSLQLRRLETWCAVQSIRALDPQDAPLPFCVALGEHATSGGEDPREWLVARWNLRVRQERLQTFSYHLERDRLVLLLDGFNEIPFSSADNRRDWMLKWRHLIHETLLANSLASVVLACRSRDLSIGIASAELPQTVVELLPLNDAELLGIAERRNPRAARRLRDAIARDPTVADLYRNPFSLTDYLAVADPVRAVPRTQSEIFLGRIRAALVRELDQNNFSLFDDRWLPAAAVTEIVDATDPARLAALYRGTPLLRALGLMASELTSTGVAKRSQHAVALELDDAVRRLGELLQVGELEAREALNAALDLDLLFTNEGVVRFKHHTLQEFFAAIMAAETEIIRAVAVDDENFDDHLGTLEQALADLGPGDQLVTFPTTGFEQVALRVSEMRPRLVTAVAQWNPWLAAEMLSSHLGREPTTRELAVVRQELIRRREATSDFRVRNATLLALGALERLHSSVDVMPELVELPAGRWDIGCSSRLLHLLGSAGPRRTVSLPTFAVSTTPITNGQFADFVADGGYDRRELWSEDGWIWRSGQTPVADVAKLWKGRRDTVLRQPELPLELLGRGRASVPQAAAIRRFAEMTDFELEAVAHSLVSREIVEPAFWADPYFSNPHQPVVGVSCHEADAYCRWLSTTSGRSFRLPTESEWEAAAVHALMGNGGSCTGNSSNGDPRGTHIEVWPTDRWSTEWGNTTELHLERTSPVGAFRTDGQQLTDLFGNVFEWTVDAFHAGDPSRRVCKGGSWRHVIARAVPGYRGAGDVTTRNDDDGFRIVEEVDLS